LKIQDICKIWSFVGFEGNPLFLSENGWEQWGTHRGEQEGESPAFRAGKGQAFPACEPDRVTAEALKGRNDGFSLQNQNIQTQSIGSPRPI
jgi:hypothetical protein